MSDWTTPGSGNWQDASKWTGGIPNATGATANFTAVQAGGGTSLIDFSQGAAIRVGTLSIVTDSNHGFSFRGASGATSTTLHFDGAGSGSAHLNIDTNGSTNSDIRGTNGLTVALDDDLIVTTTGADTFFEIAATITGAKDITKSGDGTLRIIGSANTLSGDLLVNAGRLELINAGAVGNVGKITISNGATLAGVIANFTLPNAIETGSGHTTGAIAAAAGHTLTLSGQLALRSDEQSGALNFGNATDTGTIVLSGTSLISGAGGINLAGGTVRLGNAGVAANYFAAVHGYVEVATGATLDTGGFAATIANFDMDGGTLQSSGGGALDLTSTITTGGGLTQFTGTFVGTSSADRITIDVDSTSLSLGNLGFSNWNSAVDTITLNGDASGNSITGSTQADIINGFAGNDTLNGSGGADTIRGGAGDDTYFLIDALGTLIENPGEGIDTVNIFTGGPADYTLAADFENLFFSNSAQHKGTGNSADNAITGGAGVDELHGLGGKDHLSGGSGDDTLYGDDGDDTLDAGAGIDSLFGGDGNDGFVFGSQFTAADHVDGGAGTNDQIGLQGNYTGANALTLGASTITGIEAVVVLPGSSYDITTNDANVAAGGVLKIQATQLAAGQSLTFNGATESDGSFMIFGGQGNDAMTGGAGNDGFYFGPGGFTGADAINGGAGNNDQLALDGDYGAAGAPFLLGGNVINTEVLVLLPGPFAAPNHFNLASLDTFVGAGKTMTVFGLQAGTGISFNGANEHDGAFKFFGGSGNDSFTGGTGNDWLFGGDGGDTLTGGAGADTYFYDAVSQSTSTGFDRLVGFDDNADTIDLPYAVTGFLTPSAGSLSAGSFDADLSTAFAGRLATHQAGMFTATGGDMAGHTFLVIDADGIAGYQAGSDYVMEIVSPVTPVDNPAIFV